jgi:hypothetical protein
MATMAAPSRPAALTVTCTDCGRLVDISDLSSHVCRSAGRQEKSLASRKNEDDGYPPRDGRRGAPRDARPRREGKVDSSETIRPSKRIPDMRIDLDLTSNDVLRE